MRRYVSVGLLAAGAIGAGAGFWLLRRPLALVADIMRAERASPEALAMLQRERLLDLIAFARANSAFYRERYHDLPDAVDDLSTLPVVTKPELMARFDEWVTDPAVTRTGVEAFAADPTLAGRRYLGRYSVWTTSGTTGRPGLFIHDRRAISIYAALTPLRGYRWVTPTVATYLVTRGRMAAVIAMDGHFAIYDWLERWRLSLTPSQRDRIRLISALAPLDQLVQELNGFQPNLLFGYPSTISLLAAEQRAGRLRIAPRFIGPGGEGLDAATRAEIVETFRCVVRETYGASEFPWAAYECDHGWLHVNADWVILEPVDRDFAPAPPGQPSHTTLLTNLANHAQPLIRYDLGDSVTVRPDPCPCGSQLQAIHVLGRTGDILRLRTPSGGNVAVTPLAIGAVMEETPDVYRAQIIQTEPSALVVRLETTPGSSRADVWAEMARRLDAYLTAQGAPGVTLTLAGEPPRHDQRSGKFRQVQNATRSAL
ncbi:MAG TPA: phenylacetate--CoA ligase family protein [Ktedonobacterales bacterium]